MELDQFIKEDFVQFREKVIAGLQAKHPHIFTAIHTILAEKENRIGLQVMENGKLAGEYTFNLQGIHVSAVTADQLYSEVHHPLLGIIKPYVVVERKHLEQMIQDQGFFNDLARTVSKYLPGLTIKFME